MSQAAIYFLQACGAPTGTDMQRAVDAWLRAEGSTVVGNNPWNLHIGPDCPPTAGYGVPGFKPSQSLVSAVPGLLGNRYAGTGDRNVAIFKTLQAGCAACAKNLIDHGSDFAHYDVVLAELRSGDPTGFLNAIAASSWSAGHYGYPAHNRLLDYYGQAGGTTGGETVNGYPVPKVPSTMFVAKGVTLYHTSDCNTTSGDKVIDPGRVMPYLGQPLPGVHAVEYVDTLGAHSGVAWFTKTAGAIAPVSAPAPTDCTAAVKAAVDPLNAKVAELEATAAGEAERTAAAIATDRTKAHVSVSYD